MGMTVSRRMLRMWKARERTVIEGVSMIKVCNVFVEYGGVRGSEDG